VWLRTDVAVGRALGSGDLRLSTTFLVEIKIEWNFESVNVKSMLESTVWCCRGVWGVLKA